MEQIDQLEKNTILTRKRYQRISPLYDLMETLAEERYSPWRKIFWSRVEGPKVLEIGVGTGKNMPYYPPGLEITAIDLTPGMLEKAKNRAKDLESNVVLKLGDVQHLDFPDRSFDSVVGSFVFCSVPDPILGLKEIKRIVKPGGQILLMEHVRSDIPLLGKVMDLLNPIVVRLMGANINRRTERNILNAGLIIKERIPLDRFGIFFIFHAFKEQEE